MVDYKKRELNILCKAYNNLYDFDNSRYTQYFKSEDLEDIKSMILKIQEILNKEDYDLVLNSKLDNFILKRFEKWKTKIHKT